MNRFCYLDNNATTRVAPEVVEVMLPILREGWGNPSSAYAFGRAAARRIDEARERLAAFLGATPKELVFTSCGTESNNAAIHSALVTQPDRRHILTSAVEHSSVRNFCERLGARGYDVTFLPVEADGSLDLHLLANSIRPDTAIVTVMWANNETGVVFPVEEIAALCRSRGVLFHTDAVQAAGKLPMDAGSLGADFLSLSAHKLHAPKGIGLLYVRQGVRYEPYIVGGHQERGRRGGTENVAYIAGFGRAAELAAGRLIEEDTRVRALRDRLETGILEAISQVSRNGAPEPRLPNTSNLAFEGVEAEAVLLRLDQSGICASSGSACTTGVVEPSHVLTAMGVGPARARGSVRFSLGIDNGPEDIDYLLAQLPPIIVSLRESSPDWDGEEATSIAGSKGRRKKNVAARAPATRMLA